MAEDTLVEVEGASKKFCRSLKRSLWYGVQDVASEMLGREGHHDELRKNEFWAVNDVSFELKRGECLGLIGPNGAGKSTLLKMLNGLVKPDKGRIRMRGRVGALIELGAGFNPILTARENIYVNGSVLGFSKKEMAVKFDAIVDFSEIEEFIDTPVQNFSSGMKVRLGFAVAAQMEPDVLLIDEVLAVGDAGFRGKCYKAIESISRRCAIILVSHSMPTISRICSSALLVHQGTVKTHGLPAQAIEEYLALFPIQSGTAISSDEKLQVRNLQVLPIDQVEAGGEVSFIMQIEISEEPLCVAISIVFLNLEAVPVCQVNSTASKIKVALSSGKQLVKVRIPSLQLNPGSYGVSVTVEDIESRQTLYWHHNATSLKVTGEFHGSASYIPAAEWSVE